MSTDLMRVEVFDDGDSHIREAERAAYGALGLDPVERQVRVDTGCGQVQVRITEFGTDAPGTPVLLLHGIGSASILAAPVLGHLRDRRVLAVDWPGHGLSGPCVLPPTLDIRRHATTTLASLMDGLGLAQVDIVGHSMGAQFALYTALDLGDRVRRVALLGAPGAGLVGVKPVPIMKVLATPGVGRAVLSLPMSLATYQRTQDQVLGMGALDGCPPGLSQATYLLAGRTRNAASIASFFRALLRRGRVRQGVAFSLEELGRLRQQVLFAWGDLDVFMAPATAAASIVAVPDVRLLRLPTAGHAPWLQATERVGSAVAAHIAL